MERKIGEIFEYNGEWYQCLENSSCRCGYCDFDELGDCDIIACTSGERKDGKEVHFKKLEKVGESYMNNEKIVQKYKIYYDPLIAKDGVVGRYVPGLVDIVIKQKEDMEEKKLNLKPFDLKAAKAGKPVCTRGGKKARIICFDRKFYHDGYNYPIVAMVNDNDNELVHAYTQDGLLIGNMEGELDLMMLPEKKEGWVNLYKSSAHPTKEEAMKYRNKCNDYIDTIKISWEE